MNILDDMGGRKLSAKVFLKVNYSFKIHTPLPVACLSDYHVTAKHHTAWGFRLKTETILAHQSRSA